MPQKHYPRVSNLDIRDIRVRGTYKKCSSSIEAVLQLLERLPIHQRPLLSRSNPRLDEHIRQNQRRKLNKPNTPNRPRKAHLWQQLPHHTRKHQTASRTPTRGNPQRQCLSPLKIRARNRQHGTKHEARSDAHADALGEQELRVRLADGDAEQADDLEDGAEREDSAEVAGVDEAAGEGADEEEEEDGDGADPGDVGGGAREEVGVVGLEGAKGVDPAPVKR